MNKDLQYNYKILSFFGELVAGADHEINNQLMMIEGSAHILVSPDPSPKARAMAIEAISSKVERIQRIMAELRNVLRDGEKDKIKTETVQDLTNKTIELCRTRFRNHQVLFHMNIKEDLKVECKEPQLIQALLGVLSQAHDNLGESGNRWIRVDVIEEEKDLKINIQNSGKAFTKKDLTEVFNPFKETGGKSNVGLSFAKSIAEAHGGYAEAFNIEGRPTISLNLPKYQPAQTVENSILIHRQVNVFQEEVKVFSELKKAA